MSSHPRPLLRHAASGSNRSSRASSAGGLRRLPLLTLLFLAIVLLAWNLSFYQELYLDHASAAFRKDPAGGAATGGTLVSRQADVARRAEAAGRTGTEDSEPTVDRTEDRGAVTLERQDAERIPLDPGRVGGAEDGEGAEIEGEPIVLLYADSGSLRAEGRRVDGRREGEWVEYYPDGTPLSRGMFVGDLREGPWVEYYPSGKAKQKGEYRSGLREGTWKSWHEDGQLMREGTFRNGRRVEDWIQYYTDGRPMESGRYVDGQREGFWAFYRPDGSSDPRTGWWEAGRLTDR